MALALLFAMLPGSMAVLVAQMSEGSFSVDGRSLRITLAPEQPSLSSGGSSVQPSPPSGFTTYPISGTTLHGFAAELAIDARTVVVESIEVVELSAGDMPSSPAVDVSLSPSTPVNRSNAAVSSTRRARQTLPAEWASVRSIGRLGGVRVSVLVINPYRHEPDRGRILWARSITVRVDCDAPINRGTFNNLSGAIASAAHRKQRSVVQSLGTTSSSVTAPDGFEYKLIVDGDGLYRADASELYAAGVPLASIDSRTLKLYHNGIEQPMYVWDNQDNLLGDDTHGQEYIEFFAERPRAEAPAGSDLYHDPFTTFSTYFLSWGGAPGRRLVEESGAVFDRGTGSFVDLTSPRHSFTARVHFEQDRVDAPGYNSGLNQPSDRFDTRVWRNVAAGTEQTFNVDLPWPDRLSTDPVWLRAALRGGSMPSAVATEPVVHQLELYLQGRRFLQGSILGDTVGFLDSEFDRVGNVSSQWLESDAKISVINRTASTDAPIPPVAVNWLELEYRRHYNAANDRIDFTIPDGYSRGYFRFRLRGFSSPDVRVYRRGISRITNITIVEPRDTSRAALLENDTNGYQAVFQVYVASTGEEFVAVSGDSVRHPLVLRDRSSDLKNSANGYSYVIIIDDVAGADDRLMPNSPVERFKRLKETQGHSVLIVRATDIYDEFNGGAASPWALREFLNHAHRNWSVRPNYALIIASGEPLDDNFLTPRLGHDTTWLHRRYLRERSHVPSIRFQTIDYGPTPCDYLLGCLDESSPVGTPDAPFGVDLFPEVYVGRLPVRDAADIDAYTRKLAAQDAASGDGAWAARGLYISGDLDRFGRQLQSMVTNRTRHFLEPHRIFTSKEFSGSAYDDPTRLIDLINTSGVGVVTYLGHGGGGQWEDVALLNQSNTYQLRNFDYAPVVLSYTCFTGTHRADRGLLSALLLHPSGGAVGAVGTPGLGWLINNGLLADAVAGVMNDDRYRGLPLADLIAIGKARYAGTSIGAFPEQVPTVLAMFSIFGDPSLAMPLPTDTIELRSHGSTAEPLSSIEISGSLPFNPVRVSATMFDTTEVAIVQLPASGGTSEISLRAMVPQDYAQEYIGVRVAAFAGDGRSAIGTIRFSTGQRTVTELRPIGELRAGTSPEFEVLHSGTSVPRFLDVTVDYDDGSAVPTRRVPLRRVDDLRFRSDPVPGRWIAPGARVTVELVGIEPESGRNTWLFYPDGGADPAAYAPTMLHTTAERYSRPPIQPVAGTADESLQVVSHDGQTYIQATLFNWGIDDAGGVHYAIEYDSAGTWWQLATGTTGIQAGASATVRHQLAPRWPVVCQVRVRILSADTARWTDARGGNNISLTRRSLAASGFDAGGFRQQMPSRRFTIPSIGHADLVSADRAGVLGASLEFGEPESQQGWKMLRIGSDPPGGAALRLDADAKTEGRAVLTLASPEIATNPDMFVRLVGYDSVNQLWLGYPGTVDPAAGTVAAELPLEGVYAVALVDDAQGPQVRFSAEGQFFVTGARIAPDARIGVVASDPGGIDSRDASISVFIDDEELVSGVDYVVADSTLTATSLAIRITRRLDPGTYTLLVKVHDRAGNPTESAAVLSVDDELMLTAYGNFPNPFGAETFIAYEIRGAGLVDEVEVTIYTTAGKPIRTFRYPSSLERESLPLLKGATGIPTSIGYHEAWWDGRDNDGVQVANGVYFFRIRITMDDERIEQLGTMARVR